MTTEEKQMVCHTFFVWVNPSHAPYIQSKKCNFFFKALEGPPKIYLDYVNVEMPPKNS